MEERPHAILLKFPGTNCDVETARALETVGFSTRVVPVTQMDRAQLDGAQLVVLSGGFSYGDYVMAGRLAQLETQRRIGDALKDFVAGGGYALGICNGFQILTKLGLLPEGSLIDNTSGRVKCQWAGL
jgi:phosphoribosylformylglycinamidine (FGAM) synthase-like amidotransferase family enzyme